MTLLHLVAACAPDAGLKTYNTPPEVDLTSPVDGQSFHEADTISIAAFVDDAQTPTEELGFAFGSSLDGPLEGEPVINDLGLVLEVTGLTPGGQEVILKVVDEKGESVEDRVSFSIAANEAPTVSFLSPASGAVHALGQSVHVQISASDDHETDLSLLAIAWEGIPDLSAAPTLLNGDGSADFYVDGLDLGSWALALVVKDSLGATGTASVAFEIAEPDLDGDGYQDATLGGDDCNDGDAAIHPAAYERCDGVDNDCDGATDESDALDADRHYLDADADGHGDPFAPLDACELPAGYAENDDDCDDDDANVNPDAVETCNEIDDDCDGVADDNATDPSTWYRDVDGDGYGTTDKTYRSCDAPGGYVAIGDDCDDDNASVNPAATETCNGRDDNCDSDIDEDTATDVATWYADADGDDYGDAAVTDLACDQPTDFVANADDCDDADGSISPAATETCDGVDEDCDGTVDDDPPGSPSYYADTDGDTYGDVTASTRGCSEPAGYVSDTSDCDDTDAAISPVADETCDTVDNDCDGSIDESSAVDADTWYRDADGDTYGSASVTAPGCTQPAGYVGNDDDCDDSSASVYPGAADSFYDGIDGDCAGDDDYDADGDGWASDAYGGEDCDDTDASRFPGSATWTVPGDASTIQGAIDLACTRDRIEVAAGTYVENVDYGEKAVVVVGEGADLTTLDGDFNGTPVVTMPGGTLEGFTVTNGLAPDGGGVLVSGSEDAELRELIVTDNWATTYGGGAHVEGSGDIVVEDCSFTANQAGVFGGGLSFASTTGDVSVTDTVIESNKLTSSGDGAGLYYNGAAAFFTDVEVTSNRTDGSGGGVYLRGTITWLGGSVSGNRANYYAGMYANGVLDIAGVTLDSNRATSAYSAGQWYGSGTISDLTITGNYDGYMVASFGDSLTVDGVLADGNFGTGILYLQGTQTWTNAVVRNNFVTQYVVYAYGTWDIDGLEVVDNSCSCSSHTYSAVTAAGAGTMNDAVIADNVGMNGMYVYTATTADEIAISNSTVVGNSYHGLWLYPSWVKQLDLRNLVVAYNGGYGFYDTHTTFDAVVEYTDSYGNDDGEYSGMIDPTGADGNVSVDPDFVFYDPDVDGEYWDLHLSSASPLVDMGAYSADGYHDDADGDGLPDGWESAWGVAAYDAGDDPDGDGLTQADEYAEGTDPLDEDTDGDGDEDAAESAPLVPDHDIALRIYGSSSSYYNLGTNIGFPGDVDGDGDDDLLVANYLYAFLVDGTVTGDRYVADVDDTIFYMGYVTTVVPAGDMDADGRGDIAWGYSGSGGGMVYAATSPFSSSDSQDASWSGENSGDYAGSSLAALGDTDGDGLGDLLVGAHENDEGASSAGAAYIIDGATAYGVELRHAAAKLTGEASSNNAGIFVDGPGDLDGDGISDILVASYASPGGLTYAGAVYVAYAPVSGTVSLSDADVVLTGSQANDFVGYDAGSGDFDGDGNRDLVIGAPWSDGYGGQVFVVLGPPASMELDAADGVWTAGRAYAGLGAGLDGAGDMDGDGKDDFVAGAPYVERYVGEAYVCLGPATGAHTVDDAAVRVTGNAANDLFGYRVAGGGDADDDGLGDVMIGAYSEDANGTDAGAVYLIAGGSL